jgi:hypothetical protein
MITISNTSALICCQYSRKAWRRRDTTTLVEPHHQVGLRYQCLGKSRDKSQSNAAIDRRLEFSRVSML